MSTITEAADVVTQLRTDLAHAETAIAGLRDAMQAAIEEITEAKKVSARMRKVLEWLDFRGGLGLDAHDRIAATLASEPAKVEPPGELIPVSAVLRLLREQPFAPGTHTGTRQRWVLDEVARKVEAWPEAVEPANAFAATPGKHPLVGASHGGTTVTSHHVHLPHCATQHGHEHCDCLVGREGA